MRTPSNPQPPKEGESPGLATRVRGGEVHEIGLMLLVFTPVPYVDSSAANAFRSKLDRAVVGAAGMLVETAIASLATFAWVMLEPGLARAACFNVMLIAGVSTLVFNLNPLLKYDGYFILTDLIENFERGRVHGWLLRLLTSLGGVLDPDGSTPRDLRLTFHRRTVRGAVQTMLGWAPERVVMAHGRPYLQDGTAELRRALAWAI